MKLSSFGKNSLTNVIVTLALILILVYFLYHAVSGNRGFFAMVQLRQEVTHMQVELDIVKAQRLQLEHKVQRLKDESLDLDLLDELARLQLGYAAPNEQVYHTYEGE